MHLGVIMECEYRTGRTQDEAFDEAFTLADMVEQGGLDGVWIAERHFASMGRSLDPAGGGIPSFASAPLILASALAARTSRIRLGIAVSVLPLAHPVRLAEEVATLDQISKGRLDFGVGRSGFQAAYNGYGVPYGESRERFQECLDILQMAWTQDAFSYHGQYYSFDDVCVIPKPRQKPYPPLRIAATTTDTFPLVGGMGYPIFIGLRGADVPQNVEFLAAYRAAWHEAGHPGDGDVLLRIPVYVADTTQRAYDEPMASTMHSYKRLAERFAASAALAGAVTSEDRNQRAGRLTATGYDELLRNRLAYGTPEAVVAKLRQLRDDLGVSGFIIEPNVGGGVPRDQEFRSVELFCKEVAPHLR